MEAKGKNGVDVGDGDNNGLVLLRRTGYLMSGSGGHGHSTASSVSVTCSVCDNLNPVTEVRNTRAVSE